MALQWMILTYVVAAEAAIKSTIVSLVSLVLQPALFIVPFAGFQLLDIYWKNEHRLMCTFEICTASVRDCFEKTVNGVAFDSYWSSPTSDGTEESVMYWFGFVGQDTQLLLWDLSMDEIIVLLHGREAAREL